MSLFKSFYFLGCSRITILEDVLIGKERRCWSSTGAAACSAGIPLGTANAVVPGIADA